MSYDMPPTMTTPTVTMPVTMAQATPKTLAELARHRQIMLYMLGDAFLWYSLFYVTVLMLVFHGVSSVRRYLRHKDTIADTTPENHQRWMSAIPGMPLLKKHLLYAPFWTRKRAQKSGWFGPLPTRMQTLVVIIYFACNAGYLSHLDWSIMEAPAARMQLLGRSGCAMTANFVPLILLTTRNNPLEPILSISHDTHVLMHRLVGRMILLNLLVHVGCWTVGHVTDEGWHGAMERILSVPFLGAGFIGFITGIVLFLTSLRTVRRWKYEAFLNLHIVLGLGFLLAGAAHCYFHPPPMPHMWSIFAALAVFVIERLCRYLTQLYCSWSFSSGASTAIIEALPGGTRACKITMQLRRRLDIRPGTHAYVRLEAIEPWASHPFSIAWVNQSISGSHDPEKHNDDPRATTTVSFIVGSEGGFTRKLYAKATASPDAQFTTRGSFEGPYGGHHSFASYGHVVLFAGATGLCHQLRYVQGLVQGQRTASVSAQRVVLVWIIRDCRALNWVRSWIQSLNCPPDFLEIKVFVTRDRVVPQGMWINHDLPRFVTVMSGRPGVDVIVGTEVQEQVGAMCVGVCGPGALADDVRAAVRVAQSTGREIDFVEESFGW